MSPAAEGGRGDEAPGEGGPPPGLKGAKAKTPGVADVPVHQLTIETDAGTVHLSFDDMALPKSLKPLVAFLARRSKPM